MKLYKLQDSIVAEHEGLCYKLPEKNWDDIINRDDLYLFLVEKISVLKPEGSENWLEGKQILAPVGSQEIWAAGVTYLRSKVARMEESEKSGASVFYDKVYEAERPELFFKATAYRTAGYNDLVRIRKDSTWNVPEPELTLVVTSSRKIVGYSIGNDMSSRSIEGENPLYLPQAKVYDKCAAIGPCVLVSEKPLPPETGIYISIIRGQQLMYEGCTSIGMMKRKPDELVEFLFRESSFPAGVYLMTGTCLVPENRFTLKSNDVITISIDSIGKLINAVE
ncbi:MAG: fumarylacetoacetate hydrolase family protein [Chitinophagaceae bacterium]|nr:fumarylacetoacetate hydrolase family protein [Chitinophagaceae bacterium]